jgi:K+-transporting ATPase ATPase C chain
MSQVRPAIMMIVVMTLVLGLAYPLAMTGIAQVAFPHQANGSLIEKDGTTIGSELIGQNFADAKYFHGRPSMTPGPDPQDPSKTVPTPYNGGFSVGSNYGPIAKPLVERVGQTVAALKQENPGAPVPADLATASSSGLDPDITPAGALFQVPRVAKARNLTEDEVHRLVEENTQGRFLGVIGEPHVNVLQLNMALDALANP